ncbi:MAG: geranyl transferase [Deltaproteobacteria bacterium]|nr:MAG: geranyl transferase [Deltaproteobacteria bacterium]
MDFEGFISQNIPRIEGFLPHYQDAINHVLANGGKRFRPQSIFAVINAYAPHLLETSYPIAFAYEMMHTYSLIHDDLPAMDDAPLRRGKPTLHTMYDDATAILVGDALNTHSFALIASAQVSAEQKVEIVRSLSESAGINGMALGQMIDLHFEDKHLDLEQLRFLHTKKTGTLIASALEAGAIICSIDSKPFYSLGLDLGLMFQIQDDILDATKSSEDLGKPSGNDEHKNTFVSLLGLDGALDAKKQLAQKIIQDLSGFKREFADAIKELIAKYL